MTLHITDYRHQGDALISRLFIDGKFQCLILEDWEEGTYHHFPRGTHEIRIRTVGHVNDLYKDKFSSFHHGMLEIIVPGRVALLFHIGNDPGDTLGCNLTGTANIKSGRIEESTKAYIPFYEKVISELLVGNKVFGVWDEIPANCPDGLLMNGQTA